MGQLIQSRSKYNVMREFYETKLTEMEIVVDGAEAEKDKLKYEIDKMRRTGANYNHLQTALKDKEHQIAKLRNQKRELLNLTRIEKRNELHVGRLSSELQSMKKQRVDLQRRIDGERKHYREALQRARKEVAKGRREGEKWRYVAEKNKKDFEAAQRISKARLKEANRTRSKYREAEKRLRMQTLKSGVMARAGLDSIVLGKGGANPNLPKAAVVRRWLDGMVSEVSKKEAAADKLALEWEERMDLIERRDKLLGEEGSGAHEAEELEGVAHQLKFKERRIRHLSKMFGRGEPKDNGGEGGRGGAFKKMSLLTGEDFKKVTGGVIDVEGAELAAKTLFGMVVRERRKVSSMSKDLAEMEKRGRAMEEEKMSEIVKVEALKREVEGERGELMRDHEKHLGSLMMLVGEGGSEAALKMANEKLVEMSARLQKAEEEREALGAYKTMESALNETLEEKTKECEELKADVAALLAKVHRLEQQGKPSAARPAVASATKSSRRLDASGGTTASSRAMAASYTCTTDGSNYSSSDDEEAPEWANDIIDDLALIAEGGVPEALLMEKRAEESGMEHGMGRAAAGAEERVATSGSRDAKRGSAGSSGGEFVNDENDLRINVMLAENEWEVDRKHNRRDNRGVFQRLMSPSAYTGIHKHRKGNERHSSGSTGSSNMPPPSVPPPPPPPPPPEEARKSRANGENDAAGKASALGRSHNGDSPNEHDAGRAGGLIKSKRMQEYVNRDVFERLQNFDTVSKACKNVSEGQVVAGEKFHGEKGLGQGQGQGQGRQG